MTSETTRPTLNELDRDVVDGIQRFCQPNEISAGHAIRSDPQSLPKMNKNLIINGPSNFTTSLAAFINGSTARSASVHTTSTPKHTMRPMSSPAKVQNFDINVQNDFTATLADKLNGTKKQPSAVNAAPVIKNDIKGPNSATQTPPVNIKAANPRSPMNHDDSDTDGPSDFTENLVEYMKGTKSFSPHIKMSSSATKTPPVNMKTSNLRASASHEDCNIEGPSDFTENLVEYMKGTKSFSPHIKTSSSATIAAISNASEKPEKTSSTTNEGDLRAQIAQLQAQLLQKDDTIHALQTSLTHAEMKSNDQQLELNQKDTTIDTLQTTLKQSNQQCQGLELELHQMKLEVDDLQRNLNVSPGSDPAHSKLGADGLPKDVIINTVQHKDRVINRLHDNNETLSGQIADLRVEIGDKDSMLIDHVEVVRKPQSEMDCALLKDALSQYADDLNAQYNVSDTLTAENRELEGTVSALQKRQGEMERRMKEREEREEKREEEWRARAELLLQEIDRRGAACMQLWGQLEHPGERDGRGAQKYPFDSARVADRWTSFRHG